MRSKEKEPKEKKPKKQRTPKKQPYQPLSGVFGSSTDYHYHTLTLPEKLLGFAMGAALAAVAIQIIFKTVLVSALAAVGGGIFFIHVFRDYLIARRKKELLLQFKDMLEALSNSYSVGKNTPDAFADVLGDLSREYGSGADIVVEMETIVSGIDHNFSVENLLMDFALRSDLEDVKSFADTFEACNRIGGNLRDVVSQSREIICDKIDIQMEIETTITEKKNELYVMMLMPFIIIMMMETIGNDDITANNFGNVLVKLVALALFGLAYKMGRKITDIKI